MGKGANTQIGLALLRVWQLALGARISRTDKNSAYASLVDLVGIDNARKLVVAVEHRDSIDAAKVHQLQGGRGEIVLLHQHGIARHQQCYLYVEIPRRLQGSP